MARRRRRNAAPDIGDRPETPEPMGAGGEEITRRQLERFHLAPVEQPKAVVTETLRPAAALSQRGQICSESSSS